MSAIDCLQHVHVANFFKIPVYWPQEVKNLDLLTDTVEDENKILDQYFLSIGGGSGEHPALIIEIDLILLEFIFDINEIEKTSNETDSILYSLHEKIFEKYSDKTRSQKINKNQWPLNTFISIANEIKHDKNHSFESILLTSIALFIIREMPIDFCIKDKDILEFVRIVQSGQWNRSFDINMFNNGMVGFTGVLNSQKNGIIIKNGKTVYGYSLVDWEKDNFIEK